MHSAPKAPQPTADQLALEASQREMSAKLDAQENERRKRLLNAAQGIRAYTGSPLFRSAPSNTAAGPVAAVAQAAAAAGGGGGGTSAGIVGRTASRASARAY